MTFGQECIIKMMNKYHNNQSIKIWVDDIRPAPPGYIWCKSTNIAIRTICELTPNIGISLIDLDHDAGEYQFDGGDYIRILDWLEENSLSFPIRIHSMNPVGVENMRAIINYNDWKEIK